MPLSVFAFSVMFFLWYFCQWCILRQMSFMRLAVIRLEAKATDHTCPNVILVIYFHDIWSTYRVWVWIFLQTFFTHAYWDKDKLIWFGGHKVKGQGFHRAEAFRAWCFAWSSKHPVFRKDFCQTNSWDVWNSELTSVLIMYSCWVLYALPTAAL